MANAVARTENTTVTISDDQRELIRRTVAQGATNDELELFLYDCRRRNIHPLDKLLHFTKRGGKYVPITSIDLFRSRAAESGELAGSDDATFEGLVGKFPAAATVTVYRFTQGQRCAYTATARWSEYCPQGGSQMWQKMPHTMLAKCAEALALRKGFPQQLSGLYIREEMDQAEYGPAPTVVKNGKTPHDPETGEVVEATAAAPAQAPPSPTKPAQASADWIKFGQNYIEWVKDCTTLNGADELQQRFSDDLERMMVEAPKVFQRMAAAVGKIRSHLPIETEVPETAEAVPF